MAVVKPVLHCSRLAHWTLNCARGLAVKRKRIARVGQAVASRLCRTHMASVVRHWWHCKSMKLGPVEVYLQIKCMQQAQLLYVSVSCFWQACQVIKPFETMHFMTGCVPAADHTATRMQCYN